LKIFVKLQNLAASWRHRRADVKLDIYWLNSLFANIDPHFGDISDYSDQCSFQWRPRLVLIKAKVKGNKAKKHVSFHFKFYWSNVDHS